MRILTAIVLIPLLVAPAAADPGAPAPLPGASAITSAGLMRTVEHLASREYQGRLAGGPGFMKAAREMAGSFEKLGLKPGGDRGFFQDLTTEYEDIETCDLAVIGADGSARKLEIGRDYACRGFTGSGSLTAPVVFAGYGISQPEKGYDDYAGLDVRGKIVLAFKEVPPFRADSSGWGESWMPRPKGLVAAAHGAVGLLIVSRPLQEHAQKPIASVLEGDGEADSDFPRLQIAGDVGQEMVRSSGIELAALQARIDSTRAPASRPLDVSARIQVKASHEAAQPSVNVVGILEGSDPALRNQYVVLGAHLDHVGHQGSLWYPGANDNASGAASVLAIAEAFMQTQPRPRRSIIFGLWSSEESGLYGARRFVERPPVPADSIVAYLNFDCVGHGDSIGVGGGRDYPSLWKIPRDLDAAGSKLLGAHTGGGGGADAAPFEDAKIANLYFASEFSYTHLHLPTDTPATLNPPLLESLARLGYGTARALADGEDPRRLAAADRAAASAGDAGHGPGSATVSGSATASASTAVPASAPALAPRTGNVDLRLISFGSLQGDVEMCGCHMGPKGGIARRAAWLDSLALRDPDFVQLDLGDFSSLKEVTAEYETRFVWGMIERFKVAATAIGPRELTNWNLVSQLAAKGTIPAVCSNVTVTREGKDAPAGHESLILQSRGVRLALFSLVGRTEFATVAAPNGTRFRLGDPAETARRLVPELHKEADVVVLISQMSTAETDSLLEAVPGIDVALYGYEADFDQSAVKVGSTIVNRTGVRGQYAGELVLTVDPQGRIANWQSENTALGKILPEDPEIARQVTEALAKVKQMRDDDRTRRQAEFEKKFEGSGK